jgi:hypothetical protein
MPAWERTSEKLERRSRNYYTIRTCTNCSTTQINAYAQAVSCPFLVARMSGIPPECPAYRQNVRYTARMSGIPPECPVYRQNVWYIARMSGIPPDHSRFCYVARANKCIYRYLRKVVPTDTYSEHRRLHFGSVTEPHYRIFKVLRRSPM